jgi:hypothetical protein
MGFLRFASKRRKPQAQQRIPSLRCGMTNKRAANGNCNRNDNSNDNDNGKGKGKGKGRFLRFAAE